MKEISQRASFSEEGWAACNETKRPFDLALTGRRQRFIRMLLPMLCLWFLAAVPAMKPSRAWAESPSDSFIKATESLLATKIDYKLSLIDALQKQHILQISPIVPLLADNSNLPEPPDEGLNYYIQSMAYDPVGVTHLYLVLIRSNRMGGIYTVQGSADCVTWILFTAGQAATHDILTPSIFEPGVCMLDGGESYLGVFERHTVAVTVRNIWDQGSHGGVQMAVQSWDGAEWMPPAYLIIRPHLQPGRKNP